MDKFDFEKALSRLEEINRQLSDPATGLDAGIALYEEGAKLAAACKKALDEAKKKIDGVKAE